MTLKNLVGLLILISLCSCKNSTDSSNSHTNPPGFSIKNSQRSGLGYIDTNGTAFTYRDITTIITNDSTIPMRLVIDFSKEKNTTNDSLKTTVFMLPRRRLSIETLLFPVNRQTDPGMTNELQWFLDKVTEIPVSLDTVLSPKGKCVMTFGILNDSKYADPYAIGLKASIESSSTVTLGLSFDRIPSEHHLIPCGQISFITN
jgi:hypothetical protein